MFTDSRIFETEIQAWDWLDEKLQDENCKDNYRFAYADSYWDMAYYEARADDGCCGSLDSRITVGGRPAWIGCNYGH